MRKLIIVYGLSGSGKTTMASKLCKEANTPLIDLDQYFEVGEHYFFDSYKMRAAWEWMYFKAERLILASTPTVVVCDVFSDVRQVKALIELAERYGYEVELITPATPWARDIDICLEKNNHHVPRKVMEEMLSGIKEWESELKS